MSTSQRAVMLCGWGVKACMACFQVKLCVVISERFENGIVLKGALQMFRFSFLSLYFYTKYIVLRRFSGEPVNC